VTVKQAKATPYLNANNITVGSGSGSTGSTSVSSSHTWSVKSTSGDVTASKSGNTLNVTVTSANTSTSQRQAGTVTLTNGRTTRTITVYQSGASSSESGGGSSGGESSGGSGGSTQKSKTKTIWDADPNPSVSVSFNDNDLILNGSVKVKISLLGISKDIEWCDGYSDYIETWRSKLTCNLSYKDAGVFDYGISHVGRSSTVSGVSFSKTSGIKDGETITITFNNASYASVYDAVRSELSSTNWGPVEGLGNGLSPTIGVSLTPVYPSGYDSSTYPINDSYHTVIVRLY